MSTLNPLFSKPIISYSKTYFFFDKFRNKCAIIADNANNKTTNHSTRVALRAPQRKFLRFMKNASPKMRFKPCVLKA